MASFPGVPSFLPDPVEWIRRAVVPLQGFTTGKMNNGGLVTLAASPATTTTLTDARIGFETNIILVPTTASAATELGNGTLYIAESGRVNGSVVITHADGGADRTFRFSLNG